MDCEYISEISEFMHISDDALVGAHPRDTGVPPIAATAPAMTASATACCTKPSVRDNSVTFTDGSLHHYISDDHISDDYISDDY